MNEKFCSLLSEEELENVSGGAGGMGHVNDANWLINTYIKPARELTMNNGEYAQYDSALTEIASFLKNGQFASAHQAAMNFYLGVKSLNIPNAIKAAGLGVYKDTSEV